MKKWRVFINGTNFKIEMPTDGLATRIRRMGFFTTVFVTAPTAQEAELRAVEVLRQDNGLLECLRNSKNDSPVLFADEIEELHSFRGCVLPRTGLAFYDERGPKRKKA